MKILICIDDTDDLTKETSTGAIAQRIAMKLKEKGGRLIDGISRHQLLLHEKIKYTSHNSSMCLLMEFIEYNFNEIRCCAESIIKKHMAEAADPGLAICCLEEVQDIEKLIQYGFQAKSKVLTKNDAYRAAKKSGVFLEELGGDGTGIIGALAGIGLRLSHCDGSLRGKKGVSLQGKVLKAKEMCTLLGIKQIFDEKGQPLPDTASTIIDKFAKLVYAKGQLTAIANQREDGIYEVSYKRLERSEANNCMSNINSCSFFEFDNDEEECLTANVKECFNCLFRRWTSDGFVCVKEN